MKKFLYINRRAPHGTNYAQEGLEVALIGAAFDQHVCLAFVDDGVFQLMRGQDTSGIASKNFTAAFGALGDYGVRAIYVEHESLQQRGLHKDDLMLLPRQDAADSGTNEGDKIATENTADDNGATGESLVAVVSTEQLRSIIAQADVVLNF